MPFNPRLLTRRGGVASANAWGQAGVPTTVCLVFAYDNPLCAESKLQDIGAYLMD